MNKSRCYLFISLRWQIDINWYRVLKILHVLYFSYSLFNACCGFECEFRVKSLKLSATWIYLNFTREKVPLKEKSMSKTEILNNV